MESEHCPNRDMWLDYISKLNDRALNRQRASGSTTWAVAGVIAILIVKALADLPSITTNKNAAALHLAATTGVIDVLFFASTLLILLFSMGDESAEVRLESRLDRATRPIVFVVFCVAFVLFGVANIATPIVALNSLYDWPFLILGVFFLSIAFIYPAKHIRAWIKHRKHFRELPALSYSTFPHGRYYRVVFSSATVTLFLGLCMSLVPAVQALPHITTPMHVNTLIWSLYVTGAIFLSLFVCFRLTEHRYDRFLTQLERRIVVEDLATDVIRSEFIKEFIGEDIRAWLAKAEQELRRLHDEFEQAASNTEVQFAELAKIDRSMQFEIIGRKKSICETLNKTLRAYTDYTERLQRQIEHLFDQGAPLACPDLFKQISKDWKHQLYSIKARQKAACDVCGKVSGEQEKVEQYAPPLQDPKPAGS